MILIGGGECLLWGLASLGELKAASVEGIGVSDFAVWRVWSDVVLLGSLGRYLLRMMFVDLWKNEGEVNPPLYPSVHARTLLGFLPFRHTLFA